MHRYGPRFVLDVLSNGNGRLQYSFALFNRELHAFSVQSHRHRDEDYMLALALQQEASSSTAPSGPGFPGERVGAGDPSSVEWGDEAVALALHNEERARLEQGRDVPAGNGGNVSREADRRALRHRDRCAKDSNTNLSTLVQHRN